MRQGRTGRPPRSNPKAKPKAGTKRLLVTEEEQQKRQKRSDRFGEKSQMHQTSCRSTSWCRQCSWCISGCRYCDVDPKGGRFPGTAQGHWGASTEDPPQLKRPKHPLKRQRPRRLVTNRQPKRPKLLLKPPKLPSRSLMDPKWAALGKLLNNQKRNEKNTWRPHILWGLMVGRCGRQVWTNQATGIFIQKNLHRPGDFLTFPPCGLVLLVFVLLGSAWPEVFSRHVRQSCDAVDLQEVPTQQGEQLDIAGQCDSVPVISPFGLDR